MYLTGVSLITSGHFYLGETGHYYFGLTPPYFHSASTLQTG
jgi:hypothetical protein